MHVIESPCVGCVAGDSGRGIESLIRVRIKEVGFRDAEGVSVVGIGAIISGSAGDLPLGFGR